MTETLLSSSRFWPAWSSPILILLASGSACTAFDPSGVGSGSVADASRLDGRPPADAAGMALDAAPAPDAASVDADPNALSDDVAHVPASEEFAGSDTLVLSDTVEIDTTGLTIDGTSYPPGGEIVFEAIAQELAGPDLAVLRVAGLVVQTDASVVVVGSRPLVILAGGDVAVTGKFDASAVATKAGPSGGASEAGAGAGMRGDVSPVGLSEGGGGGAGFGTDGARGGDGCRQACGAGGDDADGGDGGPAYGDPQVSVLQGGAGGGHGGAFGTMPCDIGEGGGGGGGLQIYSATSLTITGEINASGGGGTGGGIWFIGLCDSAPGGGGGGSGGSIYLQAPLVDVSGILAANGGGGGAGGNLSGEAGEDGEDGLLSDVPAAGGAPVGIGNGGGQGGADGVPPTDAPSTATAHNGGGGGGAVGRIVISSHPGNTSVTGVVSPAATEVDY